MTFKHLLSKELLSLRNSVIYLLVLLYIIVYLLGYLGVIVSFTGSFFTPVSLLVYAVLSAFLTAKFTAQDEEKKADGEYRVIRNAATGELMLPVSEITSGDSVIVSGGDFIPFSGDVVDGHAYVYHNRKLTEKKPESGRARRESYYIHAGSTVYVGNITIEVNTKNLTSSSFIKKPVRFNRNDIFSWVFVLSAALSLIMFLIRFFVGDMIHLGTYESLLDNITLSFAIISLSVPFCSGNEYLRKVFAGFHRILLNNGEAVEKAGRVNNIAADAKLLYPTGEPTFCAITVGENTAEFQNITDINLLPETLKSFVIDSIKTLTISRSGVLHNDTDAESLRKFAGLNDSAHENNENFEAVLISEIPFLPDSGYAASSLRKNNVIATEYYGKPDFFGKSYALSETGRDILSDAAKDKLSSVWSLLSKEGKRIRMIAVNHSRIKNGELPTDGWLILGYFVFPAVPTFAVKKAINAATDNGLPVSLLPSYESEDFVEYLNTSLRLAGKYSSEKGDITKKTASVIYDIASILPEADVKIAPAAAVPGVKTAADIIANTDDLSDAFVDATAIIEHCKNFRIVYKLFGIITAAIVIASFIFFSFILLPLPVAFGDDVIPIMMVLSLAFGLSETLLLKNT